PRPRSPARPGRRGSSARGPLVVGRPLAVGDEGLVVLDKPRARHVRREARPLAPDREPRPHDLRLDPTPAPRGPRARRPLPGGARVTTRRLAAGSAALLVAFAALVGSGLGGRMVADGSALSSGPRGYRAARAYLEARGRGVALQDAPVVARG